jgi:hypothetical protein
MLPSRLKAEEIPVIAGFVFNSMSRDYTDFTGAARNHFTPAYKTGFQTKLTAVENLIGVRNYWAQMRKITEDLGLKMDAIRPVLRKFEVNLNLAKNNLTISVKEFGLKELRAEVSDGNAEGILSAFGVVLKNIEDNRTPLEAKGFTEEQMTEMKGIRDSIRTLNNNQNLKTDEKEEAVAKNWDMIEELWDITKEVMDTGKNLYYYDNPERAKDYMITSLKTRVNHEREGTNGETLPAIDKGILELTVTNKSNDEPLMGAEYEVIETGDTDLTDEEGEGSAELPVGKYTVKVRMEGFVEQTISNVEITKDNTTELTIKLEPKPEA